MYRITQLKAIGFTANTYRKQIRDSSAKCYSYFTRLNAYGGGVGDIGVSTPTALNYTQPSNPPSNSILMSGKCGHFHLSELSF